MTESSEGANLANTIRGLKKFDGRNPAEFKTWMKKLCIAISVTRRDILPLLKETARPTHTSNIAEYDRANEDLYAMLFLLVELPASLCVQKHENDDEISGDGQAAFKELCNTYDNVTDEVIRAGGAREHADGARTKPGQLFQPETSSSHQGGENGRTHLRPILQGHLRHGVHRQLQRRENDDVPRPLL